MIRIQVQQAHYFRPATVTSLLGEVIAESLMKVDSLADIHKI